MQYNKKCKSEPVTTITYLNISGTKAYTCEYKYSSYICQSAFPSTIIPVILCTAHTLSYFTIQLKEIMWLLYMWISSVCTIILEHCKPHTCLS